MAAATTSTGGSILGALAQELLALLAGAVIPPTPAPAPNPPTPPPNPPAPPTPTPSPAADLIAIQQHLAGLDAQQAALEATVRGVQMQESADYRTLSARIDALAGTPGPPLPPMPPLPPQPHIVDPVVENGDYHSWFLALWAAHNGPTSWNYADGTAQQANQFLGSLEPNLNAQNVMLTPPGGNGERTKIGIPIEGNLGITDGNHRGWYRVGWGDGHLVWNGPE